MKRFLQPLAHILTWLIIMALIGSFLVSYLPLNYVLAKLTLAFLGAGCLFYLTSAWLVPTFFDTGKYLPFAVWSILILGLVIAYRYAVEEVWLSEFFSEEQIQLLGGMQIPYQVWLRLGLSSWITYGSGILYKLIFLQVKRQQQHQAILALRYETELKQLQQQIHPHFLFNAIHNIYTLATIQAPQTAPMLLKLANVLRYSLNQSQRQTVSLADEIALINDILALYALKYDPFPLEPLSVPSEAQSHRLPALILLPVVENMFKHGDVNEDGWHMQLHVLEGRLSFTTRNPILLEDEAKPEPSGLGLANVRERLKLVFGDDQHFKHEEQDSLFYVELSFPLYE